MSVKRASIKLTTPYKGSYMSKLMRTKSLTRSGNDANIKVIVRVRPENDIELQENYRNVVEVIDENMLIFDPKENEDSFFYQGVKQKCRDLRKKAHKDSKFIFDRVFDKDSTNEEVFEATAKPILEAVLDGYNCSVFAYGATGSGKTYTMLGKEGDGGIAFRTVMELFQRINDSDNVSTTEIGVSYLEIYNETVRDLLCNNGESRTLDIRENNGVVSVPGLSLHKPSDAHSLLDLLLQGNGRRSQHPTDANKESSRSHAVFQVFVKQEVGNSGMLGDIKIAKLSLIDLAGSEKGAATGFGGARFREGTNINKSLLALGNCINALADGLKHIPYRNSKLTRLIKDSIGGNCQTVMIANVGPTHRSFDDTHNTLQYATRAKNIKVNLKKNIRSVEYHISQYPKIIEKLTSERDHYKWKSEELEARLQVYERGQLPSIEQPIPKEECINNLTTVIEDHETNANKPLTPVQLSSMPRIGEGGTAEVKTSSQSIQTDSGISLLQDQLLPLFRSKRSYQRDINRLKRQEKELELKIKRKEFVLERFRDLVIFRDDNERSTVKFEGTIHALRNKITRLQSARRKIQEQLDTVNENINETSATFMKSGCSSLSVFLQQQKMECLIRELQDKSDYNRLVADFRYNETLNTTEWVKLAFPFLKHLFQVLKPNGMLCDKDDKTYYDIITLVCESKEVCWADLVSNKDPNKKGTFADLSIYEDVELSPVRPNELVVSCSKKLNVGQSAPDQKTHSSPEYDCNIELDTESELKLLNRLNSTKSMKELSVKGCGFKPFPTSVRSPSKVRDTNNPVSSTPYKFLHASSKNLKIFGKEKKSPNRVFVPETPPPRTFMGVSDNTNTYKNTFNVTDDILNVTKTITEEVSSNINNDTFSSPLDLTNPKHVNTDSFVVTCDAFPLTSSVILPAEVQSEYQHDSTFVFGSEKDEGAYHQFVVPRPRVLTSNPSVNAPTSTLRESGNSTIRSSRMMMSGSHSKKLQKARSSLTNLHKIRKSDFGFKRPILDRIKAKENNIIPTATTSVKKVTSTGKSKLNNNMKQSPIQPFSRGSPRFGNRC